MQGKNIILIGMPGAGKSTVGVLLSKETGLDFIDTDVAIQVREGKTLQQIVDQQGYLALRAIEQEVIAELHCKNTVIATGGSAVYGARAMRQLKQNGIVVFIDVPITQLLRRIGNFDTRGIASKSGQSFEALYAERLALYQQYADIHISAGGQSSQQVLAKILHSSAC